MVFDTYFMKFYYDTDEDGVWHLAYDVYLFYEGNCYDVLFHYGFMLRFNDMHVIAYDLVSWWVFYTIDDMQSYMWICSMIMTVWMSIGGNT